MRFNSYVVLRWVVVDKLNQKISKNFLKFFIWQSKLAATLKKITNLLILKLLLHLPCLFNCNVVKQNKLQNIFYFNQNAKIIEISFKQGLISETKTQIISFVLKTVSFKIFYNRLGKIYADLSLFFQLLFKLIKCLMKWKLIKLMTFLKIQAKKGNRYNKR